VELKVRKSALLRGASRLASARIQRTTMRDVVVPPAPHKRKAV